MSTFRAQVIHSGHFMTTHVHNDDPTADDDDEDIEVDVVEDDDKSEEASSGSTDKNKALDEKPVTFYKFGPTKTQSIAIDVSLNKLNKCIKVAYNKMTTPKWKDFKGLRLHWKQRIRLNNVIWRAYYIEFRKNKPSKPKKPFCYFAVPDDDTTHQKIEGSILEGMYWKRRMEAVCAQYKRWRIRSRHNIVTDRGMIHTCSLASVSSLLGRKRRNKDNEKVKFLEPPMKLQRSQTPKHTVSEEWALDFDDLNNVFTDELFDSLSQPYAFPNPREFGQSGNADIMQPGLLPLQPTIEEIMASLGDFPDSPPERVSPTSSSQPMQQPSISSDSHPMRRSNSSSASLHQMQSQQPEQTSSTSSISPTANQFMNTITDYNLMPTRQSSAITSQMLMLSQSATTSTAPPLYSTSSHFSTHNSFLPPRNVMAVNPNHSQWKQSNNFLVTIPTSNAQSHVGRLLNANANSSSSSSDPYMPQFLQSPPSNAIPDPVLAPSRSWWLDSPLTASVQSPLSVATPLPLANQNQLGGPHTPLGQLMGGGESANSPAGFIIGHNMLMETANRNLRVNGTSLAQRLEQPSIVSNQNHLFPSDKVIKSFTPLNSHPQHTQQQQSNNQFDLSTIARIRSSSLSSDTWKVPLDAPSPIQPTRPLVTSSILSPPSAFGSPSVSSNTTTMIDISESKPVTAISTAPSTSEHAMPARQTSCDPTMLASSVKNEQQQQQQQDTERKQSRQFDRKELQMTKEETPQLMSAPSSVKSMRRQVPDSTLHPEERKRILHLHAEQNRRSALKDGFDQLMEIIPDLHSGGVKPTNAVVLAKAADHIRRLQKDKWEKESKKEEAKAKIERLNQRIASLQLNLPASSSSSSSQMDSKTSLETFFDRYVKERSKNDCRFWVMSNMLKPLCVGKPNSFSSCVVGDAASRQEIAASCSDWLNANWKVMELRPFASSLLVHLATNTNMLMDPNSLKDYVDQQLKNPF